MYTLWCILCNNRNSFYRWNTSTIHIVYTKTYFENCLWFVSYGSFSQLSSRWPGQASLRDKLWRETIFKNMAGWINVSICSLIISIGLLLEKKSFVRKLNWTLTKPLVQHLKPTLLFSFRRVAGRGPGNQRRSSKLPAQWPTWVELYFPKNFSTNFT